MKGFDYYKQVAFKEINTELINPTLWLSNSLLSNLNDKRGGSPSKFIEALNSEGKKSKDLSLGQKVHSYIENPELFKNAFSNAPNLDTVPYDFLNYVFENYKLENLEFHNKDENKNIIDNVNFHKLILNKIGRTKMYYPSNSDLEYLSFLYENVDKIILSKEEFETLNRIKKGIKKNATVYDYLFGKSIIYKNVEYCEHQDYRVINEASLFWTKTINGKKVYRKGRIDKLFVFPKLNKILILDVKTTAFEYDKFICSNFNTSQLETYNIDTQLAGYKEGLEELFSNPEAYIMIGDSKKKMYVENFKIPEIESLIVTLNKKTGKSEIFEIDDSVLEYGNCINEYVINDFIWMLENKELYFTKYEKLNNLFKPKIEFNNSRIYNLKNEFRTENLNRNLKNE